MRKLLILPVLLVTLLACTKIRHNPTALETKTPKALQDNSSEISSFSKRYENDLVDELYNGLVNENPDLKEIKNLIDETNTQKDDLLEKYRLYNSKNESYYSFANQQINTISDTVLKVKLLKIIQASQTRNQAKSRNIEAIINRIEAKNIAIGDYRTVLKVIVTMPLIETYQHDNLPKDSLYKRLLGTQELIMKKIVKKIN